MSQKAFFQTFYQTEQLFSWPADQQQFPVQARAMQPDTDVVNVAAPPAVLILDPTPPIADVAPAVPLPTVQPESIQANVPEQPVSTPTQPRRPASPQLNQKVLILVDQDLQPGELLFLEKILKAVHLDVTGVDLLNVHGTQNINFNDLLSGKLIHHFFTFGVPFTRINLDILMDRYHPVRFEGITFLLADSLTTIEADVALKKQLWLALQKIFLWR